MWKETEHKYPGGSDCFPIYKAIPSTVLHYTTIQVCIMHCEEILDNPTIQYLPLPPLSLYFQSRIKALISARTILYDMNSRKNSSTY